MNNPYIYVLLNAGETEELFSELDDAAIDRLAELFFDVMEDDEDPDMPKNVQQAKDLIRRDVIEGEDHAGYFFYYELRRQPLNTLTDGTVIFEDPKFKPEKGKDVYEARVGIVTGCGMDCLYEPLGYFSEPVNTSVFPDVEWAKVTLS